MAENFQSDNDYKKWFDQLRKAIDGATAGDQSIIALLLKSLLSSFLGLNTDDSDAPDFEGVTDPVERARLERDYSQNREAGERRTFGDYRNSVGQWNQESLAKSAVKLSTLRAEEEAKNGGKPLEYTSPVSGGRINSEFGHREASATSGVGSTEHKGLDIGPPVRGEKVPVRAPMTGVVVGKGWRGGYGNMVEIVDIYGMHHRFGHLDSTSINVGDTVTRGQQFAVMGTTGHSTGVHLHYEQRDGDGNPRAPQIAGKNWDKGQVLPNADGTMLAQAPVTPTVKPVVVAAPATPREPIHPVALAAATSATHGLKTLVAHTEHPKHTAPTTGMGTAFAQAQKTVTGAAHKALAAVGLA